MKEFSKHSSADADALASLGFGLVSATCFAAAIAFSLVMRDVQLQDALMLAQQDFANEIRPN